MLEGAARDEADVQALVVMPDHWHGLFLLPENNAPGDVIRRLKGPCTPVLRQMGLRWQQNYFEHRLRPEEESEPYFRYMLANPYRAELVGLTERWPFWAITSPSAAWFIKKFPKQIPEREWLGMGRPWATPDAGSGSRDEPARYGTERRPGNGA